MGLLAENNPGIVCSSTLGDLVKKDCDICRRSAAEHLPKTFGGRTLILKSKQSFGRCADVDSGLGQFSQFLIRLFFFFKSLSKQPGPRFVTEQLSIGPSATVSCHFVMFHSLSRSDQPRVLYLITPSSSIISAPSATIPAINLHFGPLVVCPRLLSTCSRIRLPVC